MGTLVRQLMAFDKEILGVTPTPPPARLLSKSDYAAATLMSSSLKVHKKADSLFWYLGEPVFNKIRDAFTESANMARDDLQRREIEALSKGPIAKMDQKIEEIINHPRKKYKTQTTSDSSPKVLVSVPFFGTTLSNFQK
jgi:hypothetical protein